MKPFFSILVPVCNMVGKMQECVDSILNQEFEDYEVIMVDDGSKDDSYKMILDYEKADKRFKAYKHDENKSLLAARYTGMEHASGEYILFLDSDDYIEKDTLSSIYDYVKNTPNDVIRFGFRYEPSGVEELPPETDDPLKFYMEGKMPPAIWKNCYSKKVIDRTLERTTSFYCNMGEDVYFAGVLFSNADSFGVINKVFHHYVTGNGMSNSKTSASMEKIERDMKSVGLSGDNLLAFIEKYNPAYLDYAKHAVRTMQRFVLLQNVAFEDDYTQVIERINVFNNDKMQSIYEWGCNKLLVAKISKDIYESEEELKGYEAPSLRAVLVED